MYDISLASSHSTSLENLVLSLGLDNLCELVEKKIFLLKTIVYCTSTRDELVFSLEEYYKVQLYKTSTLRTDKPVF